MAATLGFWLLLAFGAPSARGQTDDELAQARGVFREGLSLEAAGEWAGALAKFEAVSKVKLTLQVRFHIARCKEHLGRLNEALGEYRLAEHEATQQSAKELPQITEALQALEPRVPKLTITRGPGAENARVELDGVALGESKIGKEVSIDPGTHRVLARLPAGAEFEQTIQAEESQALTLELVPPDDLPRPKRSKASEPSVAETKPALNLEPKSSALPWIVGGIGVASLVASGVFFALRNDAESELEDGCRDNVCPESLRSRQEDGERYATLTSITLGAGILGVGVAAVLFLSDSGSAHETARSVVSRSHQPGRALDLHVGATPRFAGVDVVGRF